MKLFSYVVDHDNGFAPNPYYGVCTLAHCKFGANSKKNVVELAQKGDWVIGTGGRGKKSVGHGKLIYAMRVDEKLTLKKYYHDIRFRKKRRKKSGSYQQGQGDNLNKDKNLQNRYVLISRRYFYFGNNAIKLPIRFREHLGLSRMPLGCGNPESGVRLAFLLICRGDIEGVKSLVDN